jgi:hypothetical protein
VLIAGQPASEPTMATAHHEADSGLEITVDLAQDGQSEDDRPEPGDDLRFPPPAYRYHDGGTAVLTAGIVTGILTYCWGLLPAWAGFIAGAIPTFLIAALLYSTHDARCQDRS